MLKLLFAVRTYTRDSNTSDSSLNDNQSLIELPPLRWKQLSRIEPNTNAYNIHYLTIESLFPIY